VFFIAIKRNCCEYSPLVNERTMLYVLKPSHDSRNCVKTRFC